MLVAAHIVEILLLIAVPLVAARLLHRRWKLPLGIFGVGMLGFFFAEVAKIGAGWGLGRAFASEWIPRPGEERATIVAALLAGLMAAIAEEGVRWAVMAKNLERRDWKTGSLAGLGMGAGEAMVNGILVFVMAVVAIVAQDAQFQDLEALGIEGRAAIKIGLRVFAWWEGSPLEAIGAGLLGLCLVVFHMGLGAFGIQGIRRRSKAHFFAALFVHFGISASLSYVIEARLGDGVNALAHGGAAVVGLLLLFATYRAPDAEEGSEVIVPSDYPGAP